MNTKLIDRVIRPTIENGVNYGAERIVLAQSGDLELWWVKSGTRWKDRLTGYGSEPATLTLVKPSNYRGLNTNDIHSGGRLSAGLIAEYAIEINKHFGADIARIISIKQTLVIEPDKE